VEKNDVGKYEPSCTLAHRLTNKLAVIVGCCDLLQSETPDESSTCSRRLLTIREAAKEIAEELNQYQCRLDAAIKSAAKKPAQKTDSPDKRQLA
jgi:hypothetical protein